MSALSIWPSSDSAVSRVQNVIRNLLQLTAFYTEEVCEWKVKTNCPACQKCNGKPFWGYCSVANSNDKGCNCNRVGACNLF